MLYDSFKDKTSLEIAEAAMVRCCKENLHVEKVLVAPFPEPFKSMFRVATISSGASLEAGKGGAFMTASVFGTTLKFVECEAILPGGAIVIYGSSEKCHCS